MNKRYYFVDYENVHEAGLEGMNQLPRESEVHLFYSQNANKLNLDLLRFVKAKLEVHRVKPGKQSLDMQMVSYLGYCIGEAGREGVFILVSKDTDYANTVLFWREEGVEVKVQPAIREVKNADGMERALKSVKVTRRGRRGGKKSAAQEIAPETPAAVEEPVKAEAEPAVQAAPAAPEKPAEAPAETPQALPQPEDAPKEEKKSTRRGRRGGRGRKAQTEAAPAETAKEPETEAPAKEEKPAVKEKPQAKAPEEKTEAKPAPVQNKAVPSEPARVTVTVRLPPRHPKSRRQSPAYRQRWPRRRRTPPWLARSHPSSRSTKARRTAARRSIWRSARPSGRRWASICTTRSSRCCAEAAGKTPAKRKKRTQPSCCVLFFVRTSGARSLVPYCLSVRGHHNFTTLTACGPFSLSTTSNSTGAPSSRDLKPSILMPL